MKDLGAAKLILGNQQVYGSGDFEVESCLVYWTRSGEVQYAWC